MYLGRRKIRSAGRTSGSIEITLPVKLQSLKGVSCTIEVRDGLRPEIVLQPNFSDVQGLIRMLWGKLALGLATCGDIGEFKLGDFTISIFSQQYWKDRPPLSYADAFHTLETWKSRADNRHDALGRLLAFMGVRAAQVLGLEKDFSLAFGDAVSFLVTRRAIGLGTDFERGMAFKLFGEARLLEARDGDLFEDNTWKEMAPGFRRVFDQFFMWQDTLENYEEDRNNWYRALSLEMESHTQDLAKADS